MTTIILLETDRSNHRPAMAQLGRNYAIILCALFAALLLVAFFNPTVSTRIAAHIPRPAAGSDSTTKTTAPPVFPDALAGKRFDGTWDVERDSRNLMLSAEQCEVAFPGLFDDIDHMVAQTKKDGIITRKYMEDIDSSSGDIGGCKADRSEPLAHARRADNDF